MFSIKLQILCHLKHLLPELRRKAYFSIYYNVCIYIYIKETVTCNRNKHLLVIFNLWLTNNIMSCSSEEEEMFVPSCVIQTSLEGCCEAL